MPLKVTKNSRHLLAGRHTPTAVRSTATAVHRNPRTHGKDDRRSPPDKTGDRSKPRRSTAACRARSCSSPCRAVPPQQDAIPSFWRQNARPVSVFWVCTATTKSGTARCCRGWRRPAVARVRRGVTARRDADGERTRERATNSVARRSAKNCARCFQNCHLGKSEV